MEYWDIYDREGHQKGYIKEKGSILEKDEYHLAMEAWIVDSQGRILLQQRSSKCELLPNIWCMTTGRMKAGEDSLSGCVREVEEELGIPVAGHEPVMIYRLIYKQMIWDIYLIKKDVSLSELRLQSDEVAQVKWVTPDEFRTMIDREETFVYPDIREILSIVEARSTQ